MDITSLIGTLLSSDSISGVSKTTKSNSGDVTSILSAALPLLLNGAQAQAEDKSTAASFSKALASHGKEDTSNIASFLDKVDMEDGSKIVAHLLGSDDSAVKDIAKKAGTNTKTVTNVLSAAAPLLMSLMGQKDNDDDDDSALGSIAATLIKNVDVGDVVGALLGGGSDSKKKSNSNADLLGNILGSLLK